MSDALSRRIDVARFVAIVLVAVSHAKNYGLSAGDAGHEASSYTNVYVQEAVTEGFCRVAVPLFMAISGFLFFRGYREDSGFFRDKLLRRVRSLVVPYVLWSLIALGMLFALQQLPISRGYFSGDPIRNWSAQKVLWTIFVQPAAGQLWFLRDLLCFIVISPLLGVTLRRWPVPIMLVLTILWLAKVTWLGPRLIYPNTQGLWFFAFGAACQLHNVNVERRVSGIVWLAGLWIVVVLVRTPHLIRGEFVPGLHQTGLIAGLLVLWALINAITPFVFAHGLHRYMLSFFVFVAHEPAQTIVEKLLLRFGSDVPFIGFAILLIAPLISVTACTAIGLLLRQFAPGLYAILTGGRGADPPAAGSPAAVRAALHAV